jgi:dephospho-CoA kinase
MDKEKIVIGIAGNIGSGKGAVTKYLTEKYKAQQMRYSKILADILERLHLDYNRDNLNAIAEGLRNIFGEDILSQVLENDIREVEAEVVVFDGIRKKKELDYFKDKTENFFFIFIEVPFEIVAQRIAKRQEKTDDQEQTVETLKARQQQASDKDVPTLKQYADFVINNEGNLKNTYKQIDEIMNKTKKKR